MLDRRKKEEAFEGEEKREKPAVGNFHLPKGGKRYQFNGLIVQFNAEYNIWYVRKSSEPDWKNILFEITGIENERIALDWARDHIDKIEVK